MNETAANLLQQNKTEKVGAGRGGGRKISSGTIFNAQIPQEEQQSGPLWQCNNLSEFKEVDDGNTRKIWIIPQIEMTKKYGDWVQYDIYNDIICPKCHDGY